MYIYIKSEFDRVINLMNSFKFKDLAIIWAPHQVCQERT